MRNTTDMFTSLLRLWALVFLMIVPLGVRAEVLVVAISASPASANGYIFAGIYDGPDPVPHFWSRYSNNPNLIVLNPEGTTNGDGPPSMLGNPSGLNIVAWAKNSSTGYDVVYSRFANGAWSAPEVLAGSPVDEQDPFLLQGPDGAIHLFYWEAGTALRVMYKKASPDLSSWTPPVQISEEGLPACRPAAVFHQGVLYVTYEVHDYGYGQTPRQVIVARQDGDAFVREVLAITHNADPIWPQIHSRNGRLWVDWIDAPGQMVWTRKDDGGAWMPIQPEPYGSTLQREFFVRGTIQYLASQ